MSDNSPGLRWTESQRKADDDMATQRNNTVAVRLDDDEHKRWKAAAAADGRAEVGRWIRETIEAGFEEQPEIARSAKSTALLRAQARALTKIAQLLEAALDGDGITSDALERIEAAVIEAKQLQIE